VDLCVFVCVFYALCKTRIIVGLLGFVENMDDCGSVCVCMCLLGFEEKVDECGRSFRSIGLIQGTKITG
jgi:hypothetical protein